MLDPDGEGPPHLLLDRPGDETAPAISPDGDFIAFVGSDAGHVDVFVLDLASGAVTQLTHDAAQEISPVWVPSS
jgi:TolB protein